MPLPRHPSLPLVIPWTLATLATLAWPARSTAQSQPAPQPPAAPASAPAQATPAPPPASGAAAQPARAATPPTAAAPAAPPPPARATTAPAASAPAAAPPAALAATPGAPAPSAAVPAATAPPAGAPPSAPGAAQAAQPAAAAPQSTLQPSDASGTPQPSAAPARAASFLDPHPTGLLPPIYSQDERRHLGFSIRLSAGAGYGWARRKLERGSSRVHGLDGLLSLDVGAAAREDLIVYGHLAGFGWNQLGDGGSANAGSAYVGMLGVGARYYLMPLNLYGSATAALAVLKITNDLGKPQNAKPGFGLDLEVGRDFWAGTPLDRRAIGVGLRFGWVHAGAAGTGLASPKPWNAFALSFVFSVGYN